MVPRRRRDPRRYDRADCAAHRDVRYGGHAHRRRGRQGRRARLHRSAHARTPRHLRRPDRRQLRPPGRDDALRGTGRVVADPAAAVSRSRRGHTHHPELRHVRRPGIDPRSGDRIGRPQSDAGRARQDARAGQAGHGRRRVRTELGPVLRARHVHADRRSGRARQGRRADGRHTRRTCATRRRTFSTAFARRSRSARRAACRRRSRITRSSARRTGARASTRCG